MSTTSLYTTSNYNPYFNSKNQKQVEKIIIFKDGEIIASVKWFSGKNGSNNRYPEVNLPTELIGKKTEDLTQKGCFLYNSCIYIPAGLVNFREHGEKLDFETDYSYNYISTFSIDIEAVAWIVERNQYGEVEYRRSEMQMTTITESHKYRSVPKPKFIEAGKIADEMEKHGVKIGQYAMFKMMQVYNLTKI